MRTYNGGHSEPLEVVDSYTVNGSVDGPVHVHDGGHLVVNGHLASADVRIGEDSFVTVNGHFEGTVTTNDGLLLVAGHFDARPEKVPGRFVVAIDSLVGNDDRLLADGGYATVVRNGGSANFSPKQGEVCVWNHTEGCFEPLP